MEDPEPLGAEDLRLNVVVFLKAKAFEHMIKSYQSCFFFHRQTGRPTRQMLNAWGEEVREEDLDQFPMEMMSKKGI